MSKLITINVTKKDIDTALKKRKTKNYVCSIDCPIALAAKRKFKFATVDKTLAGRRLIMTKMSVTDCPETTFNILVNKYLFDGMSVESMIHNTALDIYENGLDVEKRVQKDLVLDWLKIKLSLLKLNDQDYLDKVILAIENRKLQAKQNAENLATERLDLIEKIKRFNVEEFDIMKLRKVYSAITAKF